MEEKKYKRQKISGIILLVIGIFFILMGFVVYHTHPFRGKSLSLVDIFMLTVLITVGTPFFYLGGGFLFHYVRRVKKEIIHQLPSIFDTVSSIKIEKLSEILGISPTTAKRIISSYKTELLELGLDLKYEKGLIFKQT